MLDGVNVWVGVGVNVGIGVADRVIVADATPPWTALRSTAIFFIAVGLSTEMFCAEIVTFAAVKLIVDRTEQVLRGPIPMSYRVTLPSENSARAPQSVDIVFWNVVPAGVV